MDKKQIQNYRARIKKANSTLSCMGALILDMELDQMAPAQRHLLRDALLQGRAPVSYPYLDKLVAQAG